MRIILVVLKAKNNDQSILGTDDFLRLEIFIDESHLVHPKMRGRTGGAISFGLGISHVKYAKQKFSTKFITDLEVLGIIKYLPCKIYFISFIQAQR